METPRIHDNGTPRLTLSHKYEMAWDAIGSAKTALRQASPNPRDWECPDTAMNEHLARLRKLDELQDELQEIIFAIDA